MDRYWDGKIDPNLPVMGVDTEYNERGIPFVGTICDEQLNHFLYDLKTRRHYRYLRNICEDTSLVKVFHSITADMKALNNIDIEVKPPYSDTMIMSSIANENYTPKKLKYLVKTFLKEECLEEKELSKVKALYKRIAKKEEREFSFSDIPAKILYPYAKKDPEYCIKLYYYFSKAMALYPEVYEMELSLVPIIADMQFIGFNIDRRFVKKKLTTQRREMRELAKYFAKMLDRLDIRFYDKKNNVIPFKPTSSHHVGDYLEASDLPITEYTGKGAVATGAKILKKFAKKDKFLFKLLKYKALAKQTSTYYGPLYNRYTSKENSIASFQFWQSGAKTGRFSAELIQTIPRTTEVDKYGIYRDTRKAFIPRPGHRYLLVDYDQIEMRLFAHFSGCTKLVKAILKGLDSHLDTAHQLFGKKKVDKNKDTIEKYRRIAKIINFGIIYGMGVRTLSEELGLSYNETYVILQDYYRKYPVKEYMRELSSKLYKQGHITLKIDSDRMRFTRDYRVPSQLAYKSVNMIVQGTAAYIIKFALLRLGKKIRTSYPDIKMLATVHDEIIFEVPEHYRMKKIAKAVVTQMEDRVTFKVPITASCKRSDISWGDAKDYEYLN